MANEIKKTLSLTVIKSSFRDVIQPSLVQKDMAGSGGGNPGMVDIGTSEEDISFTADVVPGLVFIQNLDATNYVQYGPKSAGAMIAFAKLLPGDWHVFYLDGSVTIRAVANTAACKVIIKGYPV